MRTLAATVHVRDDLGRRHVFGPGDNVPAWAAPKITNPRAWSDTDRPAAAPTPPALQPPPRHGKGSGRDPWARYAQARGITVQPGDGRDDILDRLVAAGLPIE